MSLKHEEEHLTDGKDHLDKDVEQGENHHDEDHHAEHGHRRHRPRNVSGESVKSFVQNFKDAVGQPFAEEHPTPRKYLRSQSYEVQETHDPESCSKLLRRATATIPMTLPEDHTLLTDEAAVLTSGEEDSLGPESRPRTFSVGSQFRVRSVSISRSDYHLDLKGSLKADITRSLLLMTFIIVFGSSWQFGYNIGVLNQPKQLIKDFYNETYTNRNGVPVEPQTLTVLWSLTTSMSLPGGMIGAFLSGFLADRFGRKGATLLSHIPAFIGAGISAACVVAKAPELLLIGRFFTGLNCGLATGLAPMYLTEITPFNLRGAIGTLHQLFITLGIFFSSVIGIKEILGTPSSWPYLLLLNAFPALVSLIVLPFLPESPRWLFLIKGDEPAARKVLQFLRRTEHVGADMEEMDTENQQKKEKKESYTLMQLLRSTDLRMPLIVACMLQVIQQFSGINAIFFFSSGIFENAGVSLTQIPYAVMGTNAVNVIMTIVAVSLMDKAGRRFLLLVPMGVMIALLILLSISLNLQANIHWMSYLSVICIIGYVICFAVGLGPIPTMIGAELFRQGPRPRAMSVVGVTNWVATMVIAMAFESIQEALKEYTFLIFLGLMILFIVFVFFKVPETKNKTFEEIAHQFSPGGDIEVEEIQDEVFESSEPPEDHHLVTLNFEPRSSLKHHSGDSSNSHKENLKKNKLIPLKNFRKKNSDNANHVQA